MGGLLSIAGRGTTGGSAKRRTVIVLIRAKVHPDRTKAPGICRPLVRSRCPVLAAGPPFHRRGRRLKAQVPASVAVDIFAPQLRVVTAIVETGGYHAYA